MFDVTVWNIDQIFLMVIFTYCILHAYIALHFATLHYSTVHYIAYITFITYITHMQCIHIHAYTHTRTHLYGCIDTWTHRRMHAYMQSKPGRNIPVAPSTAQACLKAGQIRRVLERWPAVASLVSYFYNAWGCRWGNVYSNDFRWY